MLQAGQVPEGYKKIKTSKIPCDWEFAKVKNVLRRINKVVDVRNSELYKQIGIRSHGKGIFYKEAVTGAELGNKKVFWVEPNCFIVNIVFAWEMAVAKTTVNEIGMIASHRFPMYKVNESKLDLDYVTHFFKSQLGKKLLGLASPGGAGRNKTLGQQEFLDLAIPIPKNVLEQRKIAEILNTWDKGIELKQKLVDEKKAQKIWLMQNLLSPFGDEPLEINNIVIDKSKWKEVKLGKVGTAYGGLSGKNKEDFGYGKPYISYMSIFNSTVVNIEKCEYVNIKETETQNEVKYGDIFFTTSSETPLEVGMAAVLLTEVEKTYLNSFCIGFRLKDFLLLSPLFACYYFRGGYFRSILNKLAQGATRYNLSRNNLLEVSIEIPSPGEQTAIAEILSTADQEIYLMEKELAELRQQKKALMQLLLTGIVRVNT